MNSLIFWEEYNLYNENGMTSIKVYMILTKLRLYSLILDYTIIFNFLINKKVNGNDYNSVLHWFSII